MVSQHRLGVFFHEIKCNGMTSFIEFMFSSINTLTYLIEASVPLVELTEPFCLGDNLAFLWPAINIQCKVIVMF